jgi:protein-S-isoprenylcysteine O-methyltransferase Ste14
MEMNSQSSIGKTLYALLFGIILPAGLMVWARATEDVVMLPAIQADWEGGVVALSGFLLLVSGVISLIVWGKGLPMNAFPPTNYVSRGIFKYLNNPIYVGFVFLCVGVAVVFGSASGLWLVSPMVALGLTALVLGYERDDLRNRFGERTIARPLLSIPPDRNDVPTRWDRVSSFVFAFLPWTVAFEGVYRLGIPPDAVEAYMSFEHGLRVIQWTELIYVSPYLFVGLVPFFLRSQRELRRFAITGLVATAIVTLIYLTVPVVAPPRPFVPESFLGTMLTWERWMSHTVAAFPSFHVIWTLIAADAWTRYSNRLGVFAWIWAFLISISCITTGMHAIADIVFAGIVYIPIRAHKSVWEWLRRRTESIANSWREWQFGSIRVMNHGAYAAAAGGLGVLIAMTMAGPDQFWGIVIIAVFVLFGAGLWAQKLEGASGLSRPFGFYGGLLGGSAGCLTVGLLGYDTYLMFAACAIGAPVIHGLGRLRCLVQGCCHGRPTADHIGIRYHMPRSRVLEKGNLGGIPLHPTPLYSILSNAVIAVLLIRLWSLGTSLGLITGVFFLLNGIARFVEESLRGEPQTPIVGGMRIYQWTAIVSISIGITFTLLPTGFASIPSSMPNTTALVAALVFGLVYGLAMGLDFPKSNRRFARLASN